MTDVGLQFTVGQPQGGPHRNHGFLLKSSWDDWFQFNTLFHLIYFDGDGRQTDVGAVKIGQAGLEPAGQSDARTGARSPAIPNRFERLPEGFFSLGQDVYYFDVLKSLGKDARVAILTALRDMAYDDSLYERYKTEPVVRTSLTRDIPPRTIELQFRRVARGGVRLTPYDFALRLQFEGVPGPRLTFSVEPESRPPSNVHVLIGRNGVGKSTALDSLARTLLGQTSPPPVEGTGTNVTAEGADLASVVVASFSSFDEFPPLKVSEALKDRIAFREVGRRRSPELGGEISPTQQLVESVRNCLSRSNLERFARSLRLLESDPIFASIGFADRIESEGNEEFVNSLPEVFSRLSSGHKIVLLAMSGLVEAVVERSLVLLDEPEAHLHPPLLSAFTRALSVLLAERNGMAIVATHSPVVLQEVPRDCVYKIERIARTVAVSRPTIETFGENVGTLTNEVFGLEVTATGFHRLLSEAAREFDSYAEALQHFGGAIGAEGRAILRAQFALGVRKP